MKRSFRELSYPGDTKGEGGGDGGSENHVPWPVGCVVHQDTLARFQCGSLEELVTTDPVRGVKVKLHLHQEKTREDQEGSVGLKGKRAAPESGFLLNKVCAEKPSREGPTIRRPRDPGHTQWSSNVTIRLPHASGLGSCSSFIKASDMLHAPSGFTDHKGSLVLSARGSKSL